ncbi:YybH family protein [Nannocystis pusilla]|uniref:DUF4440 domain-containing protein n=1 Tax=Nannocystis pusilla TaxID=889268 RepID=A0ABS7U2M4_9BACT|nr:DUF4440 domain-containing protein [Nannocystis pusilla]MBZ5714671.1 DUF4440 domain-containing protein [Nannocystis pusilla]
MREKIRCGRDSGIGGGPLSYTRAVFWATYPGFLTVPGARRCDAEHMSPDNAAQCHAGGRRSGPGRAVGAPRGGAARGIWRGGVLVLLGVVVVVVGGCRFTSNDRRAIEGVLSEQSAAWNHGDLDGFLRAYEPSEQLLFTAAGAIRRGFAEARARYLERYGAQTETMGHLDFEILDIRGLDHRSAVVLGRWRLTQTEEAGAGVFTLVFRRDGRGWYIVHDHTSVDSDSGSPPADGADASAPASAQKQSDTRADPEL